MSTKAKDLIKRIELIVHPFDGVNRALTSNQHGLILDTLPRDDYGAEDEELMKNIYKNRILEISDGPSECIIFIPHSYVSGGMIHENVKELYDIIIDSGIRYLLHENSLVPYLLRESLLDQVNEDTKFFSWGEFTTSNVLDYLLGAYDALGINYNFAKILESLVPEFSVDLPGFYPRHWEKLNDQQRKERIARYEQTVEDKTQKHIN